MSNESNPGILQTSELEGRTIGSLAVVHGDFPSEVLAILAKHHAKVLAIATDTYDKETPSGQIREAVRYVLQNGKRQTLKDKKGADYQGDTMSACRRILVSKLKLSPFA